MLRAVELRPDGKLMKMFLEKYHEFAAEKTSSPAKMAPVGEPESSEAMPGRKCDAENDCDEASAAAR